MKNYLFNTNVKLSQKKIYFYEKRISFNVIIIIIKVKNFFRKFNIYIKKLFSHK